MSKVKIQGHASGTGILTVTAPNTSTDRTITLPDEDVTLGAATPSIDDNGNATAITIGTDEKVTLSSTDSENLFIDGGHSTNASIKIKGAYHSNLYAKLTESAGQFIISADDGNQETNSCLRFKVKGTERMRLTPDGLTFNGDTSSDNALSDYEEGTWTPVMKDTADRPLSTNTAATAAIYVKIGRQVTVTGRMTTDSVGSAGGQLMLTGLPFAAYGSSLGGYSGGTVGRASGLNIASGTNIGFAVTYGQSKAEMTRWDNGGGTTDMQVSEWSDNGWIMFCLVYQTA